MFSNTQSIPGFDQSQISAQISQSPWLCVNHRTAYSFELSFVLETLFEVWESHEGGTPGASLGVLLAPNVCTCTSPGHGGDTAVADAASCPFCTGKGIAICSLEHYTQTLLQTIKGPFTLVPVLTHAFLHATLKQSIHQMGLAVHLYAPALLPAKQHVTGVLLYMHLGVPI